MADKRNVSVLAPSDICDKCISSVTSYGLVSDEVRLIFQWVVYTVISELVDVFGTVANIINIICFVKQGFKDAVNISLLGLAVSDLCSLLTLIWTNLCFNPAFNELDLPFEPMEVQYLTGSGPHVTFTKITGCITAFITLERCLCIVIPLKVKTIFTPKLVSSIIIFVFILVIGATLPVYYVTRFGEKFSAIRNKTIIGIVFTEDRDLVEAVVFVVKSCLIQVGAFVVVVVCTTLLVVKLRKTAKWRQMSTTQGQTENVTTRDQKVTKMVIVIATFFIVCFIPVCVVMIAMVLETEFSIGGKYRNLFISVFSVCFLLESANSATNIFIYYHMSSKYRSTFRLLFTGRDS